MAAPYGNAAPPGPGHPAPLPADDAVLALDGDGMVRDCNQASEALFKYPRGRLLGQHVSMVLPELKESKVLRDGRPNPRLHFLSHIGRAFLVVACDGHTFSGHLFMNCTGAPDTAGLQLTVRRVATGVEDNCAEDS
jgi:PAS domain-containing protein